ncbi:hypothetical protein V3W47_05695 [Deinococcus sp. YIM 134068]|uniref:hypothetical protein n=1 Tax=Deinococcus lichenicola TaxID=3118910 RepID=UPI002F9329EA
MTILDPSSVRVILTTSLVHSGLPSFARSLGVVMGASIGTTLGGQIIALNINPSLVPVALLLGLIVLLGAGGRRKRIGGSLKSFLNAVRNLKNVWLGLLTGALFTVVVQSSSATVAVVITLASQDLISLHAGVALAAGAEIGTCADTLASLGGPLAGGGAGGGADGCVPLVVQRHHRAARSAVRSWVSSSSWAAGCRRAASRAGRLPTRSPPSMCWVRCCSFPSCPGSRGVWSV